ncbi:GvpL/GvpF family gas vesicle protein [Chlorobium phaeovibrioides]|uniref:Gas vesicle synthesis GvpLGvpF n=1 Tax=Chlorobium phaeovibrioides TaxID=1094 RepID=A0ABW9UQ93_CHLPH|nr:GvpL/GvpF family gas vesicle protein [Chlorobium phaeovibrioides]MWV55218.1 hypothetical protein [Chlorobium phaeovibrioides]
MPLLIHALILRPEALGDLSSALQHIGDVTGAGPLALVAVKDAGAVAVPLEKVPSPPSQEELLRYADAVEQLAALATILPMRFGSTAASPEELLRMLSANRDPILAALERVEGRVEYSLRILAPGEDGAHPRDLEGTVPDALSGGGIQREYLRRKYQAHRQAEQLSREATELREELKLKLSALDPSTQFVLSDASAFLVDLSILISRPAAAGLGPVFDLFGKEHPERPLMVTGPWPPYTFSSLTIQ